ncbi:MAG: PRC-barrel domain-containing protein [Ilumatobacter sp.]|uniref:PRC-barrel domain-containing protein n=1 Tax=Ilumatobacter sp. TaxID=1967498 RepID=UPI0032983E3E
MSDARLNLMRASDVAGLPVVTIDGGEDAAEIKDVVYEASRHHLIGFTLNKRGWFRGSMKSTLAAVNVTGIGADAVMVPGEDCLTERAGSTDALAAPKSDHDVIGNDVVSSSGAVIGTVVDVIIETGEAPQAVGYEVKTADGSVFVPSSAQMGLSAQNLIVPAEAEQFTRDDLAGFGASVASFREMIGGPS